MEELDIIYGVDGRIVRFNRPAQVKFWDYECECWRSGIGYDENIICACCGGLIPIDEIYEDAGLFADKDEEVMPIYVFDEWTSFAEDLL